MIFHFNDKNDIYSFDATKPIDISLPLKSGHQNPSCYYSEAVIFETIRAGNFIGDVSEGGPVNHKKVHFTPHGNGTHTECFGHISADPAGKINNCLTRFMFLAQLISVKPYTDNSGDHIITLKDVKHKITTPVPEAIIIRTLPNNASKSLFEYSGTNPPYLEPALGQFLAEQHIKHLLVDLPSVDKEVDGGILATHKAFWQYPQAIRKDSTITELAFIDDSITDGIYLLNLQISSFDLDVSPSKPVLYSLQKQITR